MGLRVAALGLLTVAAEGGQVLQVLVEPGGREKQAALERALMSRTQPAGLVGLLSGKVAVLLEQTIPATVAAGFKENLDLKAESALRGEEA